MKEQLTKRLEELQAEFEAGEQKLHELIAQENSLRNALLRMSGAIQVLQEELGNNNGKNSTVNKSAKNKVKTAIDAAVKR